jgi:hypothetical protein
MFIPCPHIWTGFPKIVVVSMKNMGKNFTRRKLRGDARRVKCLRPNSLTHKIEKHIWSRLVILFICSAMFQILSVLFLSLNVIGP